MERVEWWNDRKVEKKRKILNEGIVEKWNDRKFFKVLKDGIIE